MWTVLWALPVFWITPLLPCVPPEHGAIPQPGVSGMHHLLRPQTLPVPAEVTVVSSLCGPSRPSLARVLLVTCCGRPRPGTASSGRGGDSRGPSLLMLHTTFRAVLSFFNFLRRSYLFGRERGHQHTRSGAGVQAEPPLSRELRAGLDPRTSGSGPSRRQSPNQLSHPGAPGAVLLKED